MNKPVQNILNKISAIVVALLALAVISTDRAAAADESATVSIDVEPNGQLYKEALRPASWEVTTLISTASPMIYPLRRADLQMPTTVAFRPDPDMPVCPDSEVGPDVNISAPVATIVARCPQSVLGNGTALFQLAGINGPSYQREGYIVVFNGGRDASGDPKIKIFAYSYATAVGIYTESSLRDGELNFEVPRLSFDSAVTSLNINIPGEVIPVLDPAAPEGTTVPAGQDVDYVQARCPGSSWDLGGSFLLGNRDSSGAPVPPETTVTSSASDPCEGLTGQARIGALTVAGPQKVKQGQAATYRVTIPNTGTAQASGLRLRVSGRGVSLNTSVGSLAPGSSRTVRIRARFKKPGRVQATFLVASGNAASKKLVKTIRVR